MRNTPLGTIHTIVPMLNAVEKNIGVLRHPVDQENPVFKYFTCVRWCSWLVSNALAIEASLADVFVTALPANLKPYAFSQW